MRTLQRRLVLVAAAAVAVVALAALPTGAKASLLTDTITITSNANAANDFWTDIVVVGGGIELDGNVPGSEHVTPTMGQSFPALFPGDSIDVGANSITIIFAALGAGGFDYGFITDFTDLDWVGPDGSGMLVDVAFAPGATGIDVMAAQLLNITPNSFRFAGQVDLITGANFTIDLTAVHVVPLPAALPLFLSALAGLGLMGWRRRQAGA